MAIDPSQQDLGILDDWVGAHQVEGGLAGGVGRANPTDSSTPAEAQLRQRMTNRDSVGT